MYLGYNAIVGTALNTPQQIYSNMNNITITNVIIDELHAWDQDNNIAEKHSEYTPNTILRALFNGNLEAGNIDVQEKTIVGVRLKRREVGTTYFKTLTTFPVDISSSVSMDQTFEFNDYEPRNNVEYEWMACPVASDGTEGNYSSTTGKILFNGWWILDPDNPEDYQLQFIYNMDSVGLSVEEDRQVLSTFSRYAFVRYGAKYAKTLTLKSLWAQSVDKHDVEGFMGTSPIWKMIERLDEMKLMHKPFIVKGSNGQRFLGDIYSPQQTTYEALPQLSDVQVEVYEVGEIDG